MDLKDVQALIRGISDKQAEQKSRALAAKRLERAAENLARNEKLLRRLNKAKARLILEQQYVFFGMLAMDTRTKLTRTVQKFAVTKRDEMLFNPEWIESVDDETLTTALAHNALHLAFDLFGRVGGRDPQIFTICDDFANNALLKNAGFKLGDDFLYEEELGDASTEKIYDQIADKLPKGKGKRIEASGLPSCAEHQGHEDPTERAERQAKWKRKLASAAQAARQAGTMPAGLERFVDLLLSPRLPWERILAQFIASASLDCGDDTLQVPGRRSEALGYITPSELTRPEPVVLFFDTSGSMGQDFLTAAVSETQAIIRQFPGLPVRVLVGDAELQEDFEAVTARDIGRRLTGGGGTDFTEIFAELDRTHPRPRALVGFSDLWATYPERHPSFPVLWVVPAGEGNSGDAPFGRSVELETPAQSFDYQDQEDD